MQEEYFEEDDIYTDEGIENRAKREDLEPWEEGFMMGYISG